MVGTGRSSGGGRHKKRGVRSSINVLLLGDEQVGKSSLISTFVSRHFSETVPGIMTSVRLPPDPNNSSCITTIIDSQGGDAALLSAVQQYISQSGSTTSLLTLSENQQHSPQPSPRGATSTYSSIGAGGSVSAGIDNVDAIVLVYDLDRVETFYRLENHWLPLIEKCYNGDIPVIIAGNKMDLFRQSGSSGSTDEQSKARSRQQFISLLQRFKFVRQCIQCSARNLLNLDEVFLKAQEAVLCPINPLYDLTTGRLAPDCRRALTRIFRIYDKDNDFLLSNSELIAFQNETFHVPLMERDLAGWKKVVSRNNPTQEAVVREGKFTVSGFISIFDVFIDQNRLDVPWRMFRNFGYDDDLNLDIPASVTSPDGLVGDDNSIQNWKLSVSAQKFLTAMFHQFDDNKDGVLSGSDIMSVFSVIPEPSLPPWHSLRSPDVFAGCYSLPKMHTALSASSDSFPSKPETSSTTNAPFSPASSGITVISGQTSSSDASSSAVMRSFSKPLSFLEWMAHWHMVSAISPSATRAELYRLGHVEERIRKKANARKNPKRKSVSPLEVDFLSVLLASREVRVVVFGRRGCGKTALMNALCSLSEDETVFESDPLRTERTVTPETSCAYVRLKQHLKGKNEGEGEDLIVNFILTEVPEEDPLQEQNRTELSAMLGRGNGKQQKFDLVIFAFDCTDPLSVSYVKDVESELLTDEVPRVFVGTKKDMPDGSAGNWSSEHDIEAPSSINYSSAATQVKHHCAELDLEPPLLTSASKAMLGGDDEEGARQRRFTLEHLARCTFDGEEQFQLRSRPHAARKRREAARRNKMMWLGGIAVSVSVVVAVGVGVLLGGKNGERRHDRLVWLRNWFTGGSSSKAEETRA